VDNESLLRLLRSVQSSTPEEANAVGELAKKYPFSQIVHALAAKLAHYHQAAGAGEQLNRAAVYSTDRKLLKEWMVLPPGPAPAAAERNAPPPTDGEQLREELANDLQRLKRLKSNFEQSLEKFEAARLKKSGETKKIKSEGNAARSKKKKKKDTPEARKAVKKKRGKEKPGGENFLHHIQDFRPKHRAVSSGKTKKQLALIDRFIRRQPTIERKLRPVKPGIDLSQKSSELTEDIISTTFVELLIRQGKKEKAIETLKKLIWKFPRKKAIFAARIEELKK